MFSDNTVDKKTFTQLGDDRTTNPGIDCNLIDSTLTRNVNDNELHDGKRTLVDSYFATGHSTIFISTRHLELNPLILLFRYHKHFNNTRRT